MVFELQALTNSVQVKQPQNLPASGAVQNNQSYQSINYQTLVNLSKLSNQPLNQTEIWTQKIKEFIQNHWIPLLVGVAGLLTLITTVCIALSRNTKQDKSIQTRNLSLHETTQSERNHLNNDLGQRERIILSAMKHKKNHGLSCHTVATINAIIAYYHLKQISLPEKLKWLEAPNAVQKALKQIKNSRIGAADYLTKDGYISRKDLQIFTAIIPAILMKQLDIPFAEFVPMGEDNGQFWGSDSLFRISRSNINDLYKLLKEMKEDPKLCVLGSQLRGGHVVTSYEFIEGKDTQRFLTEVRDHFQSNSEYEYFDKEKSLLEKYDLGYFKVFDQLSPEKQNDKMELRNLILCQDFHAFVLGSKHSENKRTQKRFNAIINRIENRLSAV